MTSLEKLREEKRKLLAKKDLEDFATKNAREKKQLKREISRMKHPGLVKFATGVKKSIKKSKEWNKKRLEEKKRKWNALTPAQKQAILKRRRENEKFFLGK